MRPLKIDRIELLRPSLLCRKVTGRAGGEHHQEANGYQTEAIESKTKGHGHLE
jgi:hypothetical protein